MLSLSRSRVSFRCRVKWQPSIPLSLDLGVGLGLGHEFRISIVGATLYACMHMCLRVCVCVFVCNTSKRPAHGASYDAWHLPKCTSIENLQRCEIYYATKNSIKANKVKVNNFQCRRFKDWLRDFQQYLYILHTCQRQRSIILFKLGFFQLVYDRLSA